MGPPRSRPPSSNRHPRSCSSWSSTRTNEPRPTPSTSNCIPLSSSSCTRRGLEWRPRNGMPIKCAMHRLQFRTRTKRAIQRQKMPQAFPSRPSIVDSDYLCRNTLPSSSPKIPRSRLRILWTPNTLSTPILPLEYRYLSSQKRKPCVA